MPLKQFKIIKDEKPVVQQFKDFMEYIFDARTVIIESDNGWQADISMTIPGKLKQAEFEEGVQEFCDEHNCSFELVDLAPEAPSRQYFSENMKLMYPKVGGSTFVKYVPLTYLGIIKNEKEFNRAKALFKEEYGHEFNNSDKDDRTDLVDLYNEVREEEYKNEQQKLDYSKPFALLKKDPRKYEIALRLWNERVSNEEFNEEDPEQQKQIVIVYNEYMDELSEWKPVELILTYGEEPEDEEEEDESEEVEDAALFKDLLDPNNPKYKGFETSDITNAEEIDPGKEVIEYDTGEKRRISIIKYIPYGALKRGDAHYLYGVVSNYDGSDCPDIGAIVSVSLEGAKEDLDHQIQLAEQGSERYLRKGKWDKEFFEMIKDPEFDFSEEDKKHYFEKYGWDFSKPWEEQSFLKDSKEIKTKNDLFDAYVDNWLDCEIDRDELYEAFKIGLKGKDLPEYLYEEYGTKEMDYLENINEVGQAIRENGLEKEIKEFIKNTK